MNNLANSCIIYPEKRSAIKGQTLKEFVSVLKDKLTNRVEQAYIFGSYAKNEARDDSDIDIILVVATNTPFFDRFKQFQDLWDITHGMDLLIYTPREFEELFNDKTSGFWKDIAQNHIRIF